MRNRRTRLSGKQWEREFLKAWARTPNARDVAKYMYEAGFCGVPSATDSTADAPASSMDPYDIALRARPVLMAVATRYGIPIDLLTDVSAMGSALAEAIWCLRVSGMDFDSICVATNRKTYFEAVDACVLVERIFPLFPSLRAELEAIARLPDAVLRRMEVAG